MYTLGADPNRTFLHAPLPPGYVAGAGRGAVGFTTAADIGPAKDPGVAERGEHVNVLRGRAAVLAAEKETEDVSEANYDAMYGYGEKLFDPTVPYDEEDKEADEIYMNVDKELASRREAQKDAMERAELLKFRAKRPKLEQQNSELKRRLATVSEEEWANFPEPINLVGRRRKKEKNYDRITPAPDTMILENVNKATSSTSADVREVTPGTYTSGTASTAVDLTQLGTVNRQLMMQQLSGISSTLPGGTVTDMNSYMTSLQSLKKIEESEMGEFKRSRTLFKSYRVTNPTDGRSWVYSARLEEHGGQLAQARKIILKGTELCGKSELVWLEAARLHPPAQARTILAEAVKHIPSSTKIWMFAADLEDNVEAKKSILRKALELIPNSEKLWECMVNLEDTPESARVLLSRAVECVPESVRMWLALARLELPERARQVLNTAHKINPKEPSIWLTAAKLEETISGNAETVRKVIRKGIVLLKKNGITLTRKEWLKEATNCEDANALLTCQAIVSETIGVGLEESLKKKIWKRDAETLIEDNHIGTARAVYAFALHSYPKDEKLWQLAALLEREQAQKNKPNSLKSLLLKGIEQCETSELLRLMYAKMLWEEHDVPGARNVLALALKALPSSEQVWLAAVKLEDENGEKEKARVLLEQSRKVCDSRKVWIKSALFEQEMGDLKRMNEILTEAIERFPTCDKLRVYQCTLCAEAERQSKKKARELGFTTTSKKLFKESISLCPTSARLIIAATRSMKDNAESLAFLESVRTIVPNNELIWLELIRLEFANNHETIAKNSLSKARKECANSGLLIAEDMCTEQNLKKRQAMATSALQSNGDDVYVIIAVSRLFALQGRFEEGRNWLEKAAKANPHNGDVWAAWYSLELKTESQARIDDVISRCKAVNPQPREGFVWKQIRNKPENRHISTEEMLKLALIAFGDFSDSFLHCVF